MKTKILLSLAVAIASFSSSALANGYWEVIEVCDYEQIEVQEAKTTCTYSGILTSIGGGGYSGFNYYLTFTKDGPSTCASSRVEFQNQPTYDPLTKKWETITYAGTVPLVYENQHFVTTTETVKVEGSCRTENVWIPLCRNCQIP